MSIQNLYSATPIQIEFLKSGKLVSEPDERTSRDEGYAITRRSLGVEGYSPFLTSKDILGERLNIHRVDTETLRRAGVFALRRLPDVGLGLPPKLVMMRARFLPEAGTGAGGRVFQQAEFWLVDWQDWLRQPGALLIYARNHLAATTDPAQEPATQRLRSAPIAVEPTDDGTGQRPSLRNATSGTIAVLHSLLVNKTRRRSDAAGRLDFGLETFPDETSFLDAAADACQILADIAPDHSERTRIARTFHGFGIITGYTGPMQGLSESCLSFRRAVLSIPTIDVEVARGRLEDLLLTPRPAPFPDLIPLVPAFSESDLVPSIRNARSSK